MQSFVTMSYSIPDFSEQQVSTVQQMIDARYKEDIELQLADSEVQTDSTILDTTVCPTLFWNARECNFVIMRTGEDQYRAQYFYTPHDQYPTQQSFFTEIEDCAAAVLREQSDYEREAEGVKHGATAVDIN